MNRTLLLTLLSALLVPVLALTALAATPDDGRNPAEATPDRQSRWFHVPGSDVMDDLNEAGFDVTHDVERVPDGFEVEIVVADTDLPVLALHDVHPIEEQDRFSWEREGLDARAAVADFPRRESVLGGAMVLDEVTVGRVDYFTTKGQGFLSVEAKSTLADASAALLLTWNGGVLPVGGAQVMTAFTDSGEYMYHRVLATVEVEPTEVTVVSALGGTDTAPVTTWLEDEVDSPLERDGYQSGFVDGYRNPTELFDRIEALAAQHSDIAEIVELPNPTNGYQRHAQATIGAGSSAVVVSSVAWGHEGGNDVTVTITNDGTDPATATVVGTDVTVHATATTTAADVIEALNRDAGDVVTAHAYRTSGDGGTVTPTGPVTLTDNLSAPEEIERGPFTPRAIRIGAHRDGSKPGVLIIAQDHAREWVPPLVALEAVERLLANRDTDPTSADIIENVDIWVIPSNNPDGSHYSMFDYDLQRKNLTNHCPEQLADPGYRDSWGVDLNRAYSVASVHDGFAGASLTCTSSTFAGYEELSEPEARNVVDLVEANDNIRFFMTIHSNGGQLFWQPGAYIADGRQTPTRPPLGDETYYWQMAERILSQVKVFQDTVVRPDKVGGSSDVLYSSAGNVREELYVNHGVYAFGWEVGGAVWNTATRTWSSGSFQPSWTQAQSEYMEYASGVTEMWAIAADYGRDNTPPTATLVEDGEGWSFALSEPAHVYYTTDGTVPTEDSTRWMAAGIRERGETLAFSAGTTVRWLAVDPAGNAAATQEATIG